MNDSRILIFTVPICLILSQSFQLQAHAEEKKSPFSEAFVPVEDPPVWWQKAIFADRLYADQPQHAARFYKEALEDAKKANAPPRNILSLTYYFGNTQERYDALPIYIEGAKLAEKYGYKGWQATFLRAQGTAEKYMAEAGKRDHIDPAPLLKALELKPGDPSVPSKFRAGCYEDLGEIYRANNDLENSEKYTKLALAEYEQLGDEYVNNADLTAEMSLLRLRQGRGPEAIALLIEASKMYPSRISWYTRKYVSVVADSESKENEIKASAQKLFEHKKYAELDALADKLRAAKSVTPMGRLTQELIYEALGIENKSEEETKKQIALVREWIKARPNSSAAKILLAEIMRDYAWRARGSGFANTVTSDGWKAMEQRINEAWSLLQQVKPKPADWYMVASRVSLGKHLSKPEYNAMVDESRKLYPYADRILFAKAYWLQPKWFGDDGEAEKFLADEMKKRPGKDGDVFYTRAMVYLDGLISDPTARKDFDWQRMKRGFEEIVKRYPDSGKAKATFLAWALRANDKAALQTLGAK